MKPFEHLNAETIEDAAAVLAGGNACIIAGGTDLVPAWKDNILPDYPVNVVNIKTITGLEGIAEEGGGIRIGALTRLSDIAESAVVREKYTALAEAASRVASPNIRNMATIGGNVCQRNRCWYFRKPENRFPCLRKGGDECYAETGDNRFHSLFGGMRPTPAPCVNACPAGTNIPLYLSKVRAGDMDGAARDILAVNPFPMVTSRVCAHFCQASCNRGADDESVAGSAVERAVGEYVRFHAREYYAPPAAESGKTVAVVGAGAAGLSAAYYLRKAGVAVTVYDAKEKAGGMLMYAIPAYRLPKDIVSECTGLLEDMGVRFRLGQKAGVDFSPKTLAQEYDATVYATGTWKKPVIGIDGEEFATFGLDFLSDVAKWMAGKVGEDVFVAGGGNVAMDVAVTAKRLGASRVTLACLEPRGRMPASEEEIARAEQEGVTILPGWGLSRVVATEGGDVEAMELKRCLSPWDESGAFSPSYDENDTRRITAQNILLAVGQQADLTFLDETHLTALSPRGYLDVDPATNMTSVVGVFAAGDAVTGPATVIGAIAGGRTAARGILARFGMSGEAAPDDTGFTHFDHEGVLVKQAVRLQEVDAEKRRIDLEDTLSPSPEEAAAEARRCRNCACYTVTPSDTAVALLALDAVFVTNRRSIPAASFFAVRTPGGTVLDDDEILTEIHLPPQPDGSRSAFLKMAWRKSIDFPVVNCAVRTGPDPRVCLGAVAPVPVRVREVEGILAGKPVDEALAAAAWEAAAYGADPFEKTRYKAQIAKTLVKRALLQAQEGDKVK